MHILTPLAKGGASGGRPGAKALAVALVLMAGTTCRAECGCAGDLDSSCTIDGADLGLLLGAWGASGSPADLTGDGTVDGADLGSMLAQWGRCSSGCSGYSSFTLSGEVVAGWTPSAPTVVLSGEVVVLPDGEPQGSLVAIMAGGGDGLMTLAKAQVAIFVESSVVILPAGTPPQFATIDGVATTIPLLLGAFEDDLTSGLPTALWSVAGRSILLVSALEQIEPFCCNLIASLNSGTPESSQFWCKLGTSSVGGSLLAMGVDGMCAEVEECSLGTSEAIGAFPMPCDSMQALCPGGEFAGPQAAFDAVLGVWLGQ